MKKICRFSFWLLFLLIILSFIACESWLMVFFTLGNSSDFEVKVQMRYQWQTLEDVLPTEEQKNERSMAFDTTIVIPPHSAFKDLYHLGVHGWNAEVQSDIDFSVYGIIPVWDCIVAVIVSRDTIPCDKVRNRSEWFFDHGKAEFSYDIGRDVIEFYSR